MELLNTRDSSEQVLVTGSAGFIGFHAARYLLERGLSVLGVDSVNDYYDPALKRLSTGTASSDAAPPVSPSTRERSRLRA